MLRNRKASRYFDALGNFNFPSYIYESQKELMKFSFDQGNMAINDSRKLRSFKEQTKKAFNNFWFDLAAILEEMEIIEPCGCDPRSFCDDCKGSRYRLGTFLSTKQVKEVCTFVAEDEVSMEILKKLKTKQPEVEQLLALLVGMPGENDDRKEG